MLELLFAIEMLVTFLLETFAFNCQNLRKQDSAIGSGRKILADLNPLTTNVPHHIETSQLICNANQLIGFYMMGNIGR